MAAHPWLAGPEPAIYLRICNRRARACAELRVTLCGGKTNFSGRTAVDRL